MTGEERRKAIIEIISKSTKPVSGTALAKQFQVSRQVIVQDIALLRAADYDIYSAARGYMLMPSLSENKNKEVSKDTDAITRVFHVSHTDEQMEDELNTIVDMGGRVLDVYVEHAVYGAIRTALPSCAGIYEQYSQWQINTLKESYSRRSLSYGRSR